MGRPPLAVGTNGVVKSSRRGAGWESRTYVRDADGRRREIIRVAGTKAAAERSLAEALRDRTGGEAVAGDTRFAEFAAKWLDDLDASGKAPNTKRLYRLAVETHLGPAFGGLRLREIDVPRVDRALKAIAAGSGTGSGKTARSVLSGVLGAAVRQGAMPANPVRDAAPIATDTRAPRALDRDEEERVRDWPRSDPRSVLLDLPDLVDWMLGTGMRIGEALAVRYGANVDGKPLLDLDAGTVEVDATVVRVTGRGVVVQKKPKSKKGWRILALPEDLVEMLRRRDAEERDAGPDLVPVLEKDGRTFRTERSRMVFLSPRGMLRDPSNTLGDLRAMLDAIDRPVGELVGPFGWVTSHVFRKTVATRLAEAGVEPRKISDALGHSKVSMTTDVYLGREVTCAEAATALARPRRAPAA